MTNLPTYYSERIKIVDECWIWQGKVSRGQMEVSTSQKHNWSRSPRRILYELANDTKVRRDRIVVATCHDEKCINPAHAKPIKRGKQAEIAKQRGVTQYDTVWKARVTAGRRKRSLVTMELAREIRERIASGEKQTDVAIDTGLGRKHINKIWLNECWREPPGTLAGMVQMHMGAL